MFARLLILFITVPIIELFLLIEVSKRISWQFTLLIIFITAIIGARLTKIQGAQTIRNGKAAIRIGKIPHREVLDGLMILVAGALLLTPGFLTDLVGFSMLLPRFRSLFRKALTNYFRKRVQIVGNTPFYQPKNKKGWDKDESVIDAEIVDD